jgi:hypothetical protein
MLPWWQDVIAKVNAMKNVMGGLKTKQTMRDDFADFQKVRRRYWLARARGGKGLLGVPGVLVLVNQNLDLDWLWGGKTEQPEERNPQPCPD